MKPWMARLLLVAASLAAWFWTQARIARRPFPVGALGDRVHDLTAPWNQALHDHPRRADALLIASSAGIDLAGVFLLGSAIFGPSLRPFAGVLVLFALRQLCQGLCALPPPPGMIWRRPGFPSLLVTYGTANDLFFSGHTAIAVLAAVELGHLSGPWGAIAGAAFACAEAATVLLLRAHYSMDVFTGAIAALWAGTAAAWLGPRADALLGALLK